MIFVFVQAKAAVAKDENSSPTAAPGFTKLENTGVDFVSRLIPDHPLAFLYHSGMTCSGIAAGDVDGDGMPDLYIANGPGKNALFLQTGDFEFTEVTEQAGAGLDGGDDWASGVSFADVDNDGDLDIYVCNYEKPNKLFLNLGPGDGKRVRFQDVTESAGVDIVDASHATYFCDYDNDGDLDFYLLTNRVEDPRGALGDLPVEFNRPGVPTLLSGYERYHALWVVDADNWGVEQMGRSDYLFQNNGIDAEGKLSFTDVTKSSGISGRGDGLSCVWWDCDRDGDSDLFVCNDFIASDRLYINNGNGTFTNQVAEAMPHTTWFSMGSDFGDLDNDGDFDLVVADMSATSHYKSKVTMGIMGGITLQRANNSNPPQYMRNAFYVNEGDRIFREAAYMSGLSSTDWTWSIKINDFDADGMLDIVFTNGVPREMNHSDINITREMVVGKHLWDFFKEGKMRKEQNRAYRNKGGLYFKDVSKSWGLDYLGASYGAACADFDRDGDLDIAMVNLEEDVFIYRNDLNSGSQMTISLKGKQANRFGLGATVEVHAAGKKWLRQLMPSTGYHSYDEPILHFGFGDVQSIDHAVVTWPGGKQQIVRNLKINQHNVIEESEPTEPVAKTSSAIPLFESTVAEMDVWHQENEFNDFARQPLLPHRLSSEGPCMAWGDVDGDGIEDVFVGGSAGNSAELRISGKSFGASNVRLFFAQRKQEDVAALFGDFDRDGDNDLLVGRGSYQFDEGDPLQTNLLYLNDGKGVFRVAAKGTIPESATVTGSFSSCDFDKDGDVDVFVGTRVKSGAFPDSSPSELWINEGGKFSKAPKSTIAGLQNLGMVTASQWADVNGDGWPDLIVAREWDHIAVFVNDNGELVTRNSGELTSRTGWWYSLDVGDVDNDGDMDLVAGNVGLNTKYKTSLEKPMSVYYGEFDDSGNAHIVEVKQEGEACYPERGRSCSSNAMPFIAEKFESFHEFGKATLSDIYGDERLDAARKFEANTFEHAVFVNDGKGNFTFQPLPRMSQIAPSKAVKLADVDGKNGLDIVVGQNFFGPQSETGRYDGGLGQILLNDGNGTFKELPPLKSGFVVREPVTSIAFVDIDKNGEPEIVVATNNGPLKVFRKPAISSQPRP